MKNPAIDPSISHFPKIRSDCQLVHNPLMKIRGKWKEPSLENKLHVVVVPNQIDILSLWLALHSVVEHYH